LEELKYLIRRDDHTRHLLETEEYRETFYGGELGRMVAATAFQVTIK
jgi:hypothetical protein